jgi:hypothetical protein
MKYDITKPQAPTMPTLGKGTECVKILLSQASKDMHEPLVPMFFPILGAHMSGVEFQYPDLSWKETCGMMANLVAESGGNKGQLSHLVDAICRDFRQHDNTTPNNLSLLRSNMPLSVNKDGLLFFEKSCGNVWWFQRFSYLCQQIRKTNCYDKRRI